MTAYLDWLGRNMPEVMLRLPRPREAGPQLILGSAAGFTIGQVRTFVDSLRRHYAGATTLVVDDVDTDLAAYIEQSGIDVLMPERDLGLPPPFGAEPHIERHAYYAAYLSRLPCLPSRILITDVRDVVFQGDPFSEPSSAELNFYVEHDALIGTHATRRWIADSFGEPMATALGNCPCICAGTMLGSGWAIQQLCAAILFLAAIPRRGVARAFGIDQAAMNVAAHSGLVRAEVHENLRHVATMGLMPQGAASFDERGFIVNPDGSVSPIVHQYDRDPALLEAVRRHYGVDEPDPAEQASPVGRTMVRLRNGLRRRVPEVR